MYHPLIQGAIELHVHTKPSMFPRLQTDWELAADLKKAGMAGAVMKCHEVCTADRAALIREREPDLHMYGGLATNYFTGGLSPASVDAAIRLGSKIIWMPTVSAQQHLDHYAKVEGALAFKTAGQALHVPAKGLVIWDERHKVLPEVHEILDLIAQADVILNTGHISPEEVMVLAEAALEHKVRKVIIEHPDLGIARIPFEWEQELVRKGFIVEKNYLACGTRDFKDTTVEKLAQSVKILGAKSCVMIADFGQLHNLPPVQGMSDFVTKMLECGITEAEIRTMIHDNPRQLLGI